MKLNNVKFFDCGITISHKPANIPLLTKLINFLFKLAG